MTLLLCEEVLLIGLDDESGASSLSGGELEAAVIVDAIMSGAVELHEDRLRPGTEPQHPILRRFRAGVSADEPRTLTDWLGQVSTTLDPLEQSVAEGLIEQRILRERQRKVLILFNSVRHLQDDPAPERELRARLRRVLVDGVEPSGHDALLVALLQSRAGDVGWVFSREDRAVRKAAAARGEQITEGVANHPALRAADAATAAVATMLTAVILPAMIMPTIIAGGSSC